MKKNKIMPRSNRTYKINMVLVLVIALFLSACNSKNSINKNQTSNTNIVQASVFDESPSENADNLEHVKETLVTPPFLPKFNQVDTGAPKVVEVKLVVQEKLLQIAPDAKIWALTYNGSVPGPLIVVHQNDYVQVTIVNPKTNTLTHNIDFHAATGDLGGGSISVVSPGQQVTFRFKATKAGVFVYHCAPGGIMVPLHVVSGMNGAIMVLPRNGLADENGNPVKFDKAYYVAEQDYYIPKDKDGKYMEFPTPADAFGAMLQTMQTLTPSHIVFNGAKNSLTGKKALTAKVGDKVLFITSEANRDTRIHIIGGHADLYWPGGSFNNKPLTNFESWPVVGGSAVAIMYKFRQPGTYLYLDHNLINAFLFGAAAEVNVKGDTNDDLMKQISKPNKIKE
ncbi:MAG: copper-containing nitrite reductase [Lutibacter sp.]|uniref:copper-containing nitrite reductase n=1 Tax=Lutibacter sp. TaxID=1925666 RepID=UPI00299E6DAC|nr:copper-containing nitrite reductase [Lutibacter sp.]MDX1829242.1 copper-containing nitrite reductase [Lutibacter sp.]